jgi:transcriptional regulator with XRE-family HTH domain
METLNQPQKMHIGRKICRIREIRGIKQETLAHELGITQQQVSRLEQSESIEEEVLEKIAKVLEVSPDGIKNFNDEALTNLFNNISNNTFHENSIAFIYQQINPIEKIIELYERLLVSEREKVEMKNK